MEGKTVEDALILAANAHRGQKDRSGMPYITHPMHAAVFAVAIAKQHKVLDTFAIEGLSGLEVLTMVTLLHDVVEDTPVTLGQLIEEGFPEDIVQAVDAITEREGEEYDDYIARLAKNPIARYAKMGDIRHNMDTSRLAKIEDDDSLRLRKYVRTLRKLKNWAP